MRALLWQSAKAMGSEVLVTGRNIINEMADPNAKLRAIVRRNVSESPHTVIHKLSGQGRKRKEGYVH